MLYLDTHVVVWLYAGDLDRFPQPVRLRMEAEDLVIAPIVQLELQYLKEIGRIADDSALILESLGQSVGLAFCDLPFARVVAESVRQTWTRDPFDRLVVAQAALRDAPLVSKDQTIRGHYARAVWANE